MAILIMTHRRCSGMMIRTLRAGSVKRTLALVYEQGGQTIRSDIELLFGIYLFSNAFDVGTFPILFLSLHHHLRILLPVHKKYCTHDLILVVLFRHAVAYMRCSTIISPPPSRYITNTL